MFLKFIKQNIFYLLIFLSFQFWAYLNELITSNPIPYLNLSIYFIIFLLIKDNLILSKFNRFLIILYLFFFAYLSIFFSLTFLLLKINKYQFPTYLTLEIILRLFILTISIYLLLYSFRFFKKSNLLKFGIATVLSIIIMIINHYKFILNPIILENKEVWLEWNLRNYVTMVVVIFILLIFWFRYYYQYTVFSEYLNSLIFLFTLSNLIEPLHYVAIQWNVENWVKAQAFSLVLNVLMMFFWYARFVYLNSDIAAENERYLMNYQYLSGFVSKPRKSPLWMFTNKVASNSVFSILLGLGFLSLILFVIKKITLFLLLNTAFILIVVLLALFFGIRSIKRDWQNQIGFFIKNKQEK